MANEIEREGFQPSVGGGDTSSSGRLPATRAGAGSRVYEPLFERKYIVKDASFTSDMLRCNSSPTGVPCSLCTAWPFVSKTPRHHPSNGGSTGPQNPIVDLQVGPSPPEDRTPRGGLVQEQIDMDKPAPDFRRVPGESGGDGTNTDSAVAAPLLSSQMEEAIELFLEEEKLLEDLDRIQATEIYSVFRDPTNTRAGRLTMGPGKVSALCLPGGATSARSMSQGSPRRTRTTVYGRDVEGGNRCSGFCPTSSRPTVGTPASLVVAGGSPGEAQIVLPASGVGAYNSISSTKAQPTADRQHVILTALEWERFRRIVTNLLSTNIDLRSKLRSSQQHFRQLGYSDNLEQTVARLKCEELQMRRSAATREASFADSYSLRAKLSACRTGLAGIEDPLQTYQSQCHSLRDLKTVLGEAVKQAKERRKQKRSNRRAMPVPPVVGEDTQPSGSRWICPQGCAEVHKEIRAAAGRCFVVSIQVRCPCCREQTQGTESPTSGYSKSPALCRHGSSTGSVTGPPGADRLKEFDRAYVKHRADLCPSGEVPGLAEKDRPTASEFAVPGGSPQTAANSCPETFEDLHRSFLARELEEMISNKGAEVIIVIYDTMTSDVHFQTLNMREWPENATREFVHGVVLHISSNLQIQSICAPDRWQAHPTVNSLPATTETRRPAGSESNEALTLQYKKPESVACFGKTVVHGHADDSFFEEVNECLVYSGYHEVSGGGDSAKEPTYFFVFIYQRTERLLVARLYSPRSTQLLTAWIDVLSAKREHVKFLASQRPFVKPSYARTEQGAGAEAACKREDESFLLSADLLHFIVSRLRHENGRLFLLRVAEDNDTKDSHHQSNLKSEGSLFNTALEVSSHSVKKDGPVDVKSHDCRQRFFEALSVSETTVGGRTTLTFRHPQLVEQGADESGSSRKSSFVLVQSTVSLLPLEESVSFIVYDPETAWFAESSFRLLDGVGVVQSRQRTFLQKLSLNQALLEQLFEELSTPTACAPKHVRTDWFPLSHHADEPPSTIPDNSATTENQENEHEEKEADHDIGGGSAGAESSPTDGEDARKLTASEENPREKDDAPRVQTARTGAALSRLQWLALLQEIYRDLTLTSKSLMLPGVALGPVTTYA
ncbi:conserved hypothetical protein [Neospora caninum Liverpool]|uniref:Uncharacterized protein n=1 Tax=Neospora caninum (strain Liverpool) TaxID=572307 RepID=F0VPZ1_NEOCL|nr:conserved hypothetical protein [Neospora caninum Liverpool]CBZ55788.1 conserved hypothetical protein [Neospora caninum Liverpool]CEL70531.1 TPA: hypothetical protein BN1204_062140 [Neospora caninum Liverpool]|eukprot:XP_003885814.1 conserved hypothetical protein [Neospora caninum Liverpool]